VSAGVQSNAPLLTYGAVEKTIDKAKQITRLLFVMDLLPVAGQQIALAECVRIAGDVASDLADLAGGAK
jgi:hypothetical protein